MSTGTHAMRFDRIVIPAQTGQEGVGDGSNEARFRIRRLGPTLLVYLHRVLAADIDRFQPSFYRTSLQMAFLGTRRSGGGLRDRFLESCGELDLLEHEAQLPAAMPVARAPCL